MIGPYFPNLIIVSYHHSNVRSLIISFDYPIPRCNTLSGPVPPNTPCIFPFIYGGVTYLGCAGDPAEDKKDARWCSTKVDAKGNHMDGTNNYGFCPHTCPSHYEIQAPEVSVTPHGVTAVPAVTRKPKALTPELPKMNDMEMMEKMKEMEEMEEMREAKSGK